jgi:aldehyde dehydrogenase (NAD+)
MFISLYATLICQAGADVGELWAGERLLIDGALVPAASGATFDNVDPATGERIGSTADAGSDDLLRAIAAARRAFDGTDWSTNVALRVRCLRQLQDALVKHADAFRASLSAETGATRALTALVQFDMPVQGLAWVADLLERYAWEKPLAPGFGGMFPRTQVREPVGVVAAITPWNYPLQINLAKLGPALAAGNTLILKPAPDSPWSATLIGELAAQHTDIPPGVLNVVATSRDEVAERLVTDPRVDLLSFTGSTATGRRLAALAAASVKRVFLELGGKSACVVLDDADVAAASAACANMVTIHAGQGCALTTRLLLPRGRYAEGVAAAKAALEATPYGDPRNPASGMMGPLISERQRQRVLAYVRKGVEEGARVVTGGGIPGHLPKGGFYVEPTLLADVAPDATVAQEEIFGPVLVAIAHDGDDDAVAIANRSIYGLSGAVWAGTPERGNALARRLRTGTVGVNGGMWFGHDVPFGGYKQSGIGREMGVEGFEQYTEIKVIAGRAAPRT